MKSNFIPVGKAKKKAYRIVKDHDKTLEEFDVNKVNEANEALEQVINRTQIGATQIANAMWWQRMGMIRTERQFLRTVVDEVASPRQVEIEPIDISDVENLLMSDMEGNEL